MRLKYDPKETIRQELGIFTEFKGDARAMAAEILQLRRDIAHSEFIIREKANRAFDERHGS